MADTIGTMEDQDRQTLPTPEPRQPPRQEKGPTRPKPTITKLPDGTAPPATWESRPLPPWDRTVDVVCHNRHHHSQPLAPTEEVFTKTLKAHLLTTSSKPRKRDRLSSLPSAIRFRIISHLLPSQSRPVTLSRRVFTNPAWPNSTLRSLRNALAPLQRYLRVSPFLRSDVLVAFLITTKFHVVMSPFVGPRMSPLATVWLERYGPCMQALTVEVDFTRLGLGGEESSGGLGAGMEGVQRMLGRIGVSQKRRAVPLRELVLLCRRYYGERPAPIEPKRESGENTGRRESSASVKSYHSGSASSSFHDPDSSEPVIPRNASATDIHTKPMNPPNLCGDASQNGDSWEATLYRRPYCPDEHLQICNQLLHLQGRVTSLRVCGFGEEYTRHFTATLFPKDTGRYAYRLVVSGEAWPRIPGQSAWVEESKGELALITFTDEKESDKKFDASYNRWNKVWKSLTVPPPPVLHADGSISLPSANAPNEATHRPRRNRKRGTTMPLGVEGVIHEAAEGSGNAEEETDKANTVQKLLDKCGMGKEKKKKKRVLSRYTASTF